ncbi:MAG TPA: alcohol dehydrogenase catalytic domain-containing protein [Candidatus Binataceae bacterium]|nr:alcohol dehydrogenase catalytic domain-containing protein [Candidatus Binataceae bacterium]
MKAIAKTRPAPGVEVIDVPVPKPGPNQILVKVAACGICGSDLHIYLWELGADRALSGMPAVIGHEPAGEVVELGAGVTEFKVGDHVALDPFGPCGRCTVCQSGRFNFCLNPGRLGGAFAEYCVASVQNAWLVPKAMDLEQVALLEPFATGVHAVEESTLRAGDSCVVEGPGPIGLSVALAARALGVTTIVMTGLKQDEERLALARKMGFKTVCASDSDWTEQVRALMPGDGADVVFDAAGFLDSVRHIVRRNGELVEVGWPARDIPNAEMRALFFHGVKIIPSRVRVPQTWRRAIALVAGGLVDLKPMVTHRFDLDHGIEAFELLHNKQGVKALILPRPE